MNPESHFIEAYALAARIVRTLLDGESPGLVLSIDVGGSFFDSIASSAATTAGHNLVRTPSLRRYRSQLLNRRLPPRPADVIGEAVVFGRVDGFVRTGDEDGLLDSYVTGTGDVATRSVDSWLSGRANLRLVHFGDVPLLLDQVVGAAGALSRDRPIVTLYPVPGFRAALLEQFRDLGYHAFNLGGRPVEAEEPEQPLDFGWILLPNEKRSSAFATLATAADADEAGPASWTGRQAIDRDALPRQRRSSDVFGLRVVEPPQPSRTIAVSDIVCCSDCYPVEFDRESSWRWLGPRPRTRLAIPCPLPGAYRFKVTVLNCNIANGLANCRVLVEGREMRTAVHGVEHGTIEFAGHLEPAGYEGYVEIDLVNPGSPLPAGADPRTLRMSIASISVSPWL